MHHLFIHQQKIIERRQIAKQWKLLSMVQQYQYLICSASILGYCSIYFLLPLKLDFVLVFKRNEQKKKY